MRGAGIGSLVGRPNNTMMAGDDLVSGSILLRYISIAVWYACTSKEPTALIFAMNIRFTGLTATLVMLLACAFAADEWCTPHLVRNSCVTPEVN